MDHQTTEKADHGQAHALRNDGVLRRHAAAHCGFFLAGGTLAGMWGNAAAFAPLLLCVGAHLVMHKFMGKSCHSNEEKGSIEETPVSVPSAIPVVARNRR